MTDNMKDTKDNCQCNECNGEFLQENPVEFNDKYMTRWQHKETKKIVDVLPWWDCYSNIIDKPSELLNDPKDTFTDRKFSIGVLIQVGFLIRNENGVWFGVGPNTREFFDDIGPDVSKSQGE